MAKYLPFYFFAEIALTESDLFKLHKFIFFAQIGPFTALK